MNQMKKRNALGRGLGALLEDSVNVNKERADDREVSTPQSSINEISLDQIEVNPFQPRTHFDKDALEELSDSIKTQGIIQPITVRMLEPGKFQLISGERRFQASKLAGLTVVPAYVRTANDQQMLEMALIENIQRENLNAIEVALSYQRLLSEVGLKQEELGGRVGKNRTTVNNYLRLLKLPPDIQIAVRDNIISMGHARALITIDSVDQQLDIFKKVVKEELSVRKTETLVRDIMAGVQDTDQPTVGLDADKAYEYKQLQGRLSNHFGTKIQIKADPKDKGEIKIPFMNTDDLNRILELLNI
jgi:ParB family transcriptional regulator, chromosome partitioning protein